MIQAPPTREILREPGIKSPGGIPSGRRPDGELTEVVIRQIGETEGAMWLFLQEMQNGNPDLYIKFRGQCRDCPDHGAALALGIAYYKIRAKLSEQGEPLRIVTPEEVDEYEKGESQFIKTVFGKRRLLRRPFRRLVKAYNSRLAQVEEEESSDPQLERYWEEVKKVRGQLAYSGSEEAVYILVPTLQVSDLLDGRVNGRTRNFQH